jgi:hypothetical protein
MTDRAPFMGDKFEQLVTSKPFLESVGVHVPEIVGIEQSVVDESLAESSLPTIDEADDSPIDALHIESRLVAGKNLVDHLVTIAEKLSDEFDGPLIMRSSGRGDAVGIGVYESSVHGTDAASVGEAYVNVVASYFSAAPFSGNAKLGTPRSPQGSMRLQPGFGSGVAIPGLPIFEFSDHADDDNAAEWEATERLIRETSHRNNQAARALDYAPYVDDGIGDWRKEYGEFIKVHGVVGDAVKLTVAGLIGVLSRAHDALGGGPTYLEFVAREEKGNEVIYVVQKGNIIPARGDEAALDSVPAHQIMLREMVIEAGNGFSPKFDTIVCLTDEDKTDLYRYDSTEDAKNGYLVAFGAVSNPKRNPLNLRLLKNVKGIVTLETSGYAHTSHPKEHLVGYSDALGIPLISISNNANDAWIKLNGFSWDGDDKGRDEGSLITRKGNFQIVTDPSSRDGVILDLDRQ